MKENPKMAVQLEREVREAVGLPVDDVVEVKEVAVDAKEVALEGEKA
jgi:hypothetical protein